MEIDELKSKISNLLRDTKSIMLFLVLQDDNGFKVKKADIDNGETTDELNNLFRTRINELFSNEELSLISLSNTDERKNAIYEYDYSEYPDKMSYIKDFDINKAVNYDIFSFSNDSLSSLVGYIIYIGDMNNGIVCFKKHYPISVIKRGTFLIGKYDERFKKIDTDDIIRLNGDINLFKFENTIYVLDIETIEKYMGFEGLIRNRANEALASIEQTRLIDNMVSLKDASVDFSFSKKLSKVAEQSLIITKRIPNEKVINFSKNNPGLRNKFKYNDSGDKIILDTKSSRLAFIKLLNDDYLVSELTEQPYDSLAKDKIMI